MTKPVEKLKKFLPVVITVVVLFLLGLTIWYGSYYNRDEKVLSDAFYNLLGTTEGTSDITVTFTGGSDDSTSEISGNIKVGYTKGAVAVDVDGLSIAGNTLDAALHLIIASNGDLYAKVDSLDNIINTFSLSGLISEDIDTSLVSDIWIQIAQEDIDNMIMLLTETDYEIEETTDDADYIDTKCFESIATTLAEKRSVQDEILKAITSTELLTAKRAGGDDKNGIKFHLTGDPDQAADFAEAMTQTELYRALDQCVDQLDENTSAILREAGDSLGEISSGLSALSGGLSVEAYFWVSGLRHQPTRFAAEVQYGENLGLITDMTRQNGQVDIAIPSDEDVVDLTSVVLYLLGYDENEEPAQ